MDPRRARYGIVRYPPCVKYQPDDAPKAILALVDQLVPLLIQGEHPALAALRQQLPQARVREVEMTGCGFYISFDLPNDVPLTEPSNFAGGSATIRLAGADHPAGCVLFVRSGRLATLEGYTYAGDNWPANAVVVSVEDVDPVMPGDEENLRVSIGVDIGKTRAPVRLRRI